MSPDAFLIVWTGQIATVRLPGEVDVMNADAVLAGLTAALDGGAKVVIADMSGTTFCDSAGLATLVRAHRHATANQARLRLVTTAPAVQRVLSLTGVETIVPVFATVSDALSADLFLGLTPRRTAAAWARRRSRCPPRRWRCPGA